MSLQEHANQTIKHLQEQLSLERQRSQVLVKALNEIEKNTWNGDGNNRRAKEALKKYEEMGK